MVLFVSRCKTKRCILYQTKIRCSVAVPVKMQALLQWRTDPGRQCRRPAGNILYSNAQYLWAVIMEFALCLTSDAWNFEMASGFLDNVASKRRVPLAQQDGLTSQKNLNFRSCHRPTLP
jgi:hypothetical protein